MCTFGLEKPEHPEVFLDGHKIRGHNLTLNVCINPYSSQSLWINDFEIIWLRRKKQYYKLLAKEHISHYLICLNNNNINGLLSTY